MKSYLSSQILYKKTSRFWLFTFPRGDTKEGVELTSTDPGCRFRADDMDKWDNSMTMAFKTFLNGNDSGDE